MTPKLDFLWLGFKEASESHAAGAHVLLTLADERSCYVPARNSLFQCQLPEC